MACLGILGLSILNEDRTVRRGINFNLGLCYEMVHQVLMIEEAAEW